MASVPSLRGDNWRARVVDVRTSNDGGVLIMCFAGGFAVGFSLAFSIVVFVIWYSLRALNKGRESG